MNWNEKAAELELDRIVRFIRANVQETDQVVVPVSGGLDSDITARLCCKSIGKERIRFFFAYQEGMEACFAQNARELAEELEVPLAEFHLENLNMVLMSALEIGEESDIFSTHRMLDPEKAKCSIRSAVISCYQDKGFLIAGSINRSEKELGFFLTFGDNLAHFKPIAHLYKSQLIELAKLLGTKECVITQKPSAGFWKGQTDLEDLSYWIINDGPIVRPREFSDEEQIHAKMIERALTQERIDIALELYSRKEKLETIMNRTGLTEEIINGLTHIVDKAKLLKNRPIMLELE